MFFRLPIVRFSFILAACLAPFLALAQDTMLKTSPEKNFSRPAKVWQVPDNNDYTNDTSRYSFSRMVQSDNIAVLWSKEFGQDPMSNTDAAKRFTTDEVLRECERFYNFYVNDLKFVEKGKSLTD